MSEFDFSDEEPTGECDCPDPVWTSDTESYWSEVQLIANIATRLGATEKISAETATERAAKIVKAARDQVTANYEANAARSRQAETPTEPS